MGLFKAIGKAWKEQSIYNKIKIVQRIACSLGGGFLGGTILAHYFDDDGNMGVVDNVCTGVFVYGLSLGAAKFAADNIDHLVDSVEDLADMWNGKAPEDVTETTDEFEEIVK